VDIFDQAQERDALFRETALKEHFKKSHSPLPSPLKGEVKKRNCKDCGEPIPKKRLKAKPGAERCIGCQTNYEQRRD
jgi:phage/conjugal plasmid C-4 type zinc finger TraR family protein